VPLVAGQAAVIVTYNCQLDRSDYVLTRISWLKIVVALTSCEPVELINS